MCACVVFEFRDKEYVYQYNMILKCLLANYLQKKPRFNAQIMYVRTCNYKLYYLSFSVYVHN